MFGKMKLKVLNWSVIFSVGVVLISCQKTEYIRINGNTQGTTYTILTKEVHENVNQNAIDSILHVFDLSLSTYIDSSQISSFNSNTLAGILDDKNDFFKNCYEKSLVVYRNTNGLFDPSVFPLIEGWGFFKNVATPLSKDSVNKLLVDVGLEPQLNHQMSFEAKEIRYKKHTPFFKLDFNAIAQGYAVDVLADYIKSQGINDFYIEIGGEIRVSGLNKNEENWSIGIDVPDDQLIEREIENVIYLSNSSVATSGNYRKYYIKDGKKYAHTINPKTGYPVEHNLLSVTVVSRECAFADAYATAFMVMGEKESLKWIKEHPEVKLEAYFLSSSDGEGITVSMSAHFKDYLIEE